MICKDVTFDNPVDNILYDEVLLSCAEENPAVEYVRFWESAQYFVVLGKIGRVDEDVHVQQIRIDQIPLLRRSSGGGTVIQGPGCLNYTLVLSKDLHPEVIDLKKSYAYILEKVVQGLNQLNIQAEYLPISDIALVSSRKKFSGNAQKRQRKVILHHGTLLDNFSLDLVTKYLKQPRLMPEYRHARAHHDFIINLNVGVQNLKRVLKQVFSVSTEELCTQSERQRLQQLTSQRNPVICSEGDKV